MFHSNFIFSKQQFSCSYLRCIVWIDPGLHSPVLNFCNRFPSTPRISSNLNASHGWKKKTWWVHENLSGRFHLIPCSFFQAWTWVLYKGMMHVYYPFIDQNRIMSSLGQKDLDRLKPESKPEDRRDRGPNIWKIASERWVRIYFPLTLSGFTERCSV